jgi:hypothetical protein
MSVTLDTKAGAAAAPAMMPPAAAAAAAAAAGPSNRAARRAGFVPYNPQQQQQQQQPAAPLPVHKTALQGASELSGKAAAWVGGWFSQPSTADSCNNVSNNSGRAGNSNKRGRGKRSSCKRGNSKARADVYLTAALVFMVVALAGSSLAAVCSMSSSGSGSVMTAPAAPLPLASSTGLVYSGPLPAAFSAGVMCPGNHTAASWAAHCSNATPAGSYTAGCAATLVSVAKDAAAADGITLWNVTRMNATQQAAAAAAVSAQQCAPVAPLLPLCPVCTPTAADVTCALQAGQGDSLLWHLARHHAKQEQQQRAEGEHAVSAPGEEASSSACDMQAHTRRGPGQLPAGEHEA